MLISPHTRRYIQQRDFNLNSATSNYSFGTISIDVTAKPVNLSGSKTYDGSTSVSASDLSDAAEKIVNAIT